MYYKVISLSSGYIPYREDIYSWLQFRPLLLNLLIPTLL